MRWRFLDSMHSVTPWREARGRKAVSLEEYYLLQPLGREGVFPESLCLECCVEVARWLVATSSEFRTTCALAEAAGFTFRKRAVPGDTLDIAISVVRRDESGLTAECRVICCNDEAAQGRITVEFLPLKDSFDAGLLSGMWKEIYAPA